MKSPKSRFRSLIILAFVALGISLLLALIPYPIEPHLIDPNTQWGESEYITAHGIPEPIYITSSGPLEGFAGAFLKALIYNWIAIFFWLIFFVLIFKVTAYTGIAFAHAVNIMRRKKAEQGAAPNAYPRHAFCWLATLAGRNRAAGRRR